MAATKWDRLALRAASAETASSIPVFLYGTAWKKGRTADLVYQALCSGFTAVDTAAQPKHYREDLVGEGIQTKYTAVSGQNPDDMPYDPKSSIAEQVHASIKSSLRNLRPSDDPDSESKAYLDALVLHSPLPSIGQTLEAWAALEEYVPDKIRHLGISNCPASVLSVLHEAAKVKPAVVQNRFFRKGNYDREVRRFCNANSIVYQSFWTLTANPDVVFSAPVGLLANQLGISPQAAMYCLVLSLGNIVILNGTTKEERMVDDLQAPKQVEEFAMKRPDAWERVRTAFKDFIGESNM
ncbi:hypothetical protein UREG_04005 [Uncinocarpus reesii 1704]|uniref:NADP-dependent oxidoreductase domain-containing protein n=1 Tax=Uncinocarpus reesii (strain UAMH 1704) TaxID=336963 RepID=C4JME7_UNCRE|nr:uncharacterized protein UREG_04005 [Uncinocarpus reesii 1704]EEP79159.1 hypothetical protein UREG_04005 [Uncinocarpus reesii 1704]